MANIKPGSVPAWKSELTEKLAQSRARRSGRLVQQPRLPLDEQAGESSRTSSVAAAVAARFAGQPSYRELLEREAIEAALAAEQALMTAQAAQQEVRERMDDARAAEAAAAEAREAEEQMRAAERQREAETLAVRIPVDERTERHMQAYEARQSAREPQSSHQPSPSTPRDATRFVDPIEDATVAPAVPLAANLIQFPRELVATRKVRPRLAEGPLRDAEPQGGQLRIFEVDSEAVDRRPTGGAAAAAAGSAPGLNWASIRLDTPRPEHRTRTLQTAEEPLPIVPAPMGDRFMAALVDGALSFAGFLLFVFVFCACTAHPPTGKVALLSGVAALVTVFIGYQWLFFRFGSSTPGMAYAHIALCTMDDNNPTRGAMQRRIGALLLAALPLGLGLVWAMFDEHHLGWHDRISGTYQRSYR